MPDRIYYNLFLEFIDLYSGGGFRKINDQNEFMTRFNKILHRKRQYFYVADILKLQLLYTSPQIYEIIGIKPENNDLSYNLINTHPQDIQRRSKARVNVIALGQEIFLKKSGPTIVSSNYRIKKLNGEYINSVIQCYLFHKNFPVETVYIILITTQVDKLSNFIQRGHYHWYAGSNLSYFRYPDKYLLNTGTNVTIRELEIIKLIQEGMDSKEISRKLFLSPFTVNTHRRNILKKTGKASMAEVIYELQNIGIL